MSSTNALSSTEETSMVVPSKRDAFLATYCHHQTWSLPDSIVYYITKNPLSSKCYQKMIQSCKYFFVKNPILVLSGITTVITNQNRWKNLFNDKTVDLKKSKMIIWIVDQFNIDNVIPLPLILNFSIPYKIYRSEIKELNIDDHIIFYNDLILLASSKCEKIRFCYVTVENADDTVVVLEKVVEALPNVKQIYYSLHEDTANAIVTSKTVQNLLKISHFSNLDDFVLTFIPESFDINTFYSYLKKNKKTKFELCFDRASQQYDDRLHEIVNEILDAENRDYKPPYIEFSRMTLPLCRGMRLLYES